MKKFVIVDGNAIVHRAYHAIPPLTTKEGVVVNAVYGFISMLLKVLNDIKPEYVAITFDEAGPTFRHKKFDKYKATRVKAEQALYDQIPLTREALGAFQFAIFSKSGYEADDVIGTLVKAVAKNDVEVFVVTGDMDTLQLVEDRVKVYTLRKGINDIVVYDPKTVKERFGFGPESIVDYKAIRGDTSDNIPGVPGIGEKGATELIQKIGSLKEIYKKIDSLKKEGFSDGLINKLKTGKESAELSFELATLDTNVPGLEFKLEECRVKPFEREKILAMFQKFEFVSLLKRIPEFKNDPAIQKKEVKKKTKSKDHSKYDFVEITDSKIAEELVEKILEKKQFSAKAILSGELFAGSLAGLAIGFGDKGYFIKQNALKSFIKVFENKEVELVGHDIKQTVKALKVQMKIDVENELFDTMVGSYILSPGNRTNDVNGLIFKVLGKELVSGAGQESLFGVDAREAAYEQFLLLSVAEELKKDLEKIDNLGLLKKIEMPLISVLSDMEIAGVAVDINLLKNISDHVVKEIKKVTEKIFELAGEEFNISSPVQLREVLFEKMDLPTDGIKKGKTGLSTSAEELEKLKDLHPIINEISSYRELTKLQNTYIETLPTLINKKTGRIHSSFNQTIAATGRLSSSDPNLQNIPIRTELGREIRNAFIAAPGFDLVAADYSQIELRVVASLAEDKKMIEIFNQDLDIHRATAAAIHGVPLEKVTKEMRYSAKEINFGVLYGMGVYGLSWRANIPQWQAKEFIEKYFSEFSGVKKYLENTLAFTKKEGYCETLFGRRRYLPELNSTNYQARSSAERMAVNHPVQGTAADLIKMAMIEVREYIRKEFKGDEVRLILQVHDELVLEVKEELSKAVGEKVNEIMEKVVKLRVPVKVGLGIGKRWGEIK